MHWASRPQFSWIPCQLVVHGPCSASCRIICVQCTYPLAAGWPRSNLHLLGRVALVEPTNGSCARHGYCKVPHHMSYAPVSHQSYQCSSRGPKGCRGNEQWEGTESCSPPQAQAKGSPPPSPSCPTPHPLGPRMMSNTTPTVVQHTGPCPARPSISLHQRVRVFRS